jgi:hypothetical protein
VAPGSLGRPRRPLEDGQPLVLVGRYRQQVLEVGQCLDMRVEGRCAFGGGTQGNACLGGDGVCLWSLRRRTPGVEVVAREDAGKFVVAE